MELVLYPPISGCALESGVPNRELELLIDELNWAAEGFSDRPPHVVKEQLNINVLQETINAQYKFKYLHNRTTRVQTLQIVRQCDT